MARLAGSTKKRHGGKSQYGLYDMAQTRGWNTENALAWGSTSQGRPQLSPATRLPKSLSPLKLEQHNGKGYISNDQNKRKKRMFVKTTDDECETSFPVNIELGWSNMTPEAQFSIFSYAAIVMMTQDGWSPWSPQASYDRRRHRNCFPTKSASISEKVNISWGHRSVDAIFTCVDLHLL